MKRLIILFLFNAFATVVQAQVQVQIVPDQITMGQTFQLTLTQEDPRNGGVPDLSALQNDFVILGTERHVNYTVVNGQTSSASQWIISLKPLKTGVVTIPAMKLGLEETVPMTINVGANAVNQPFQDIPSENQDVMLVARADEEKPYINQQIIYNIKLYNSKRLLDVDYQGPQIEDALVVPLGDAMRSQVVQNNTNYILEEQNYAIFPQKSGNLKIVSPTFTALVYDMDPQRIKVQDKTLNLTIKPIPTKYSGKKWLPAKQVKISEHYENAGLSLSQGSTLTRTVTLEGVAIPAQLLPILNFEETDAFNVYVEKGADRNLVKQNDLVGSTIIKVTYLFNKEGNAIIPKLRLPWFNTTSGKEEIAVLPLRSMKIGALGAPVAKAVNSAKTSKPDPEQAPIASNQSDTAPINSWAWITAVIFAFAWVITLIAWFWQRRARQSGKGQYKVALRELKSACSQCNPKRARDAVLKWASLHWPDTPLLNLTDLSRTVRDAHLKKQLTILSQVLYQGGEKKLWRGDELIRAVNKAKRSRLQKKRQKNVLPPMNPLSL